MDLDAPVPMTRLCDILTLSPLGAGRFSAESLDTGTGIAFGGQHLAQSIVAAHATLPQSRHLHSVHAHFISPGNPRLPVELQVVTLQQGTSSARRSVTIFQDGRQLAFSVVSFQVRGDGPVRRLPSPTNMSPPAPGTSPPLHVLPSARQIAHEAGIEIAAARQRNEAVPQPNTMQYSWVRSTASLPADPLWQAATAALASDLLLTPNVLEPGDDPMSFQLASLDHAMWFFGSARMDEWTLFGASTPLAGHGRSITFAHVFARGEAIASVAQEALVRHASK